MTASGRVLNDPALTNAGLSNIGRVSALCNQAILEYNAGRRSFSKARLRPDGGPATVRADLFGARRSASRPRRP